MAQQEPIAIVGRGCVLPGCHSPAQLWAAVEAGKNLITSAPAGIWGLTPEEHAKAGYKGGFVTGFDSVFDSSAFDLGATDVATLDPVFQWPLHAAMDAWNEAGRPQARVERIGVILANLSYPSRAKADHAGDLWLAGASRINVLNAFNSGLPPRMIARALGATGEAFSLDAACASSLYAIHIACRKLQARTLDIVVTCAVNAADNLMLHRGFSALQALSPSGQSRPFSAQADGLVPSEGAAALILKRLSDIDEGETVFAVIRGTGLANDGRRRGLLAPDETGQLEAMRRAYQNADIAPDTIGYLECHATGTPVGDSVEVRSATQLYGERSPLPAGSLKSNTGHLITVAGMAGLLKMIAAIRHETLPPTLLDGPPIDAFRDSPLAPQTVVRDWASDGPRRAAISNFGFGGNNAHLILEEYQPAAKPSARRRSARRKPDPIVICGIGLLAGNDRGNARVVRRLMTPQTTRRGICDSLTVNPVFARTPPDDLRHAEPQQLAVLDVSEEALEGINMPPPGRIGVFVGMGCSSNAARWLLRERLARRMGHKPCQDELIAAQDRIVATIDAADVLGAMPNMPANRLNACCDFQGQGFTIAADGLSGHISCALACEALAAGEIDLALVAAADFASESVRALALQQATNVDAPADLAAALVLKRQSAAEADGDNILAYINTGADADEDTPESNIRSLCRQVYGEAPIAAGIFDLAAAARLAQLGQTAGRVRAEPWIPTSEARSTRIPAASGFGKSETISMQFPDAPRTPDPLRPAPVLYWTQARSRVTLLQRIHARKKRGVGAFRLAVLGRDDDQLEQRLQQVTSCLAAKKDPGGAGIYFGAGTPIGELAFVFTGSAAAYPRMGRRLLMAFPELAHKVGKLFPEAARIAGLLSKPDLTAYEQLCAVTLLSQAQTLLLRDMLGVKPDAVLGLSLGETNSLIAFGFWKDAGYLLDEIAADRMYETYLGGEFETARVAWNLNAPAAWTNWRIYAPLETVRAAVSATAHTEITIIYTDEDCVIGGPPDECKAVADTLRKGAAQVMNQHLIVHARAMQPYADTWRALHTRPTSVKPEVRIYTNAGNCAYSPSKRKVADVLTQQAVSTINFPKTIEQAYADGVRTFVEIGPRDTLTTSIDKILGERPHLAVAADRIETSDLQQIAVLTATLYAEGRNVDMALIETALAETRNTEQAPYMPAKSSFTVPAHFAPPAAEPDALTGSSRATMPPAPPLAPPHYPAPVIGVPVSAVTTTPRPLSSGPTGPSSVPSGQIALTPRVASGPTFSRVQLEASARGKISCLYGNTFSQQDSYTRQVRLPAPPLLLVERITGIDSAPGIEGKGVIWTETDVSEDAWYMHAGYMQPGPLIEAGQADLSLISWMGADFKNKDERVYRLLGCELTLHEGGLPRAGETLRYQIEITGHATLSGVRMFFFQYDCSAAGRRLFSVRNGQAGFFTDDELAAGKGVLWNPAIDPAPTARPAAFDPARATAKRAFSALDLANFRRADAYACFGAGFEVCASQTNPPRIAQGKLELFDSIPVFDPIGGPWQRGYLQAQTHVPTDAWFYAGHFHEDPCMPGTLMAEAAVQAMAFYAAAVGLTTTRDGFVFEPVCAAPFKFICRGQVIPDGPHDLTYEVFIDDIIDGDTPVIFAALLATSDDKKVFYCPRFGIRLRRNWPVVAAGTALTRIGPLGESRGDWAALKACGDGAPSDAFGDMYAPFDLQGRVPRLPQPPYHMVSRILSISTRPNMPAEGATVVTEYDAPEDAWYFADNKNGAMPFAVLVEIVLQPCGWLASHGGFAHHGGEAFRNLDGEGRVLREVRPGDGPIRVEATMTRFSRAGPMTIIFFELQATLADGSVVMTLETSFGFFPLASLTSQTGLKISAEQRAMIALPTQTVPIDNLADLLPRDMLKMLDRVDYFDASGGNAGLGLARGQQDIDPYAWYFKAHFYQDPVQPGSLGLDALLQLLMRAALLQRLADEMRAPRFQSVAAGENIAWTYRGQVTPIRKRVTSVLEITAITQENDSVLVTGDGSAWCDGLRIYGATNLSVRLFDEA